ncbi:MAG: Arc family DNA-binding protein [Mesorhizobium sp.]|uniref:Arc family DNA-binding protein n=1 Tax=Mesorhizobium sp. TaxID=1871066 RepID=UPI000FE6C2C3|nr:Arc family DNA-binding protein [Mesorhizobium sp.]RWG14531.1 MAG: Arc family DNA-binding protein [Mesorhizobium sp.]
MAPIDRQEVRLRLPAQLKKLAKVAAAENERSLNEEIVARLERSFGHDDEDRQRAARLLSEALSIIDKGAR